MHEENHWQQYCHIQGASSPPLTQHPQSQNQCHRSYNPPKDIGTRGHRARGRLLLTTVMQVVRVDRGKIIRGILSNVFSQEVTKTANANATVIAFSCRGQLGDNARDERPTIVSFLLTPCQYMMAGPTTQPA